MREIVGKLIPHVNQNSQRLNKVVGDVDSQRFSFFKSRSNVFVDLVQSSMGLKPFPACIGRDTMENSIKRPTRPSFHILGN